MYPCMTCCYFSVSDPSQLVDSGAGQGAVLASGILILAAATHLLQLV